MRKVNIYIHYKWWKFKKSLSGSKTSATKIRVWWQIYTILFIAIILLYIRRPHYAYILFAVASLIVMMILSVIKDYQSGAHIHWERKVRYLHGRKEEDNNR